MKHFFAIISLFFCISAMSQSFSISGKIVNYAGSDSIKFLIYEGEQPKEQSIFITNTGEFSIKQKLKSTQFAKVYFNPNDFVLLIITPKENITIEANFIHMAKDPVVKGSVQTTEWYNTLKRIEEISVAIETKKQSFQKSLDSLENIKRDFIQSHVAEKPTSLSNLAIAEMLDIKENPELFIKIDENLSANYGDNPIVANFHKTVNASFFLKEGSTIPNIILKTADGKDVSLESLRGKVVLIDFWASWCRPCRMEIPYQKEAYEKLHSKGFDIYAVSIDRDKNAWLSALQQEKMPWHQVYDLNQVYASKFNVSSIPFTILIDENGKVLTTNIRGTALYGFLETYLAEKNTKKK